MSAILLRYLLLILPGMILVRGLLPARPGRALDLVAFGPLVGLALASGLDLALRHFASRPAGDLDLLVVLLAALGLAFLAGRRGPVEVVTMAPAPVAGLIPLAALAGFAAVVFAARLASAPDGAWDGMAVWGLLGRILAGCRADPRVALESVTLTQCDYPLLLPGSLALLQGIVGPASSLPGQLVAITGFLSLLALMQRLLHRLADGLAAQLGPILLLAAPAFLLGATDQYADHLVAAGNLAAAGLLALAIRGDAGRRRWLLLAGLFLGILPWTKAEGAILALVLVSTALGFMPVTGLRRRLAVLGPILAGALPGLITCLGHRLLVAPSGRRLERAVAGAADQLFDLERWRAAFQGLGREFGFASGMWRFWAPEAFDFRFQRWGLLFPTLALILMIALLRRRLDRSLAFLIVAAALQLLAYVAVFALYPERPGFQIETAAPRLVIQVVPLLVLAVVATTRRARPG